MLTPSLRAASSRIGVVPERPGERLLDPRRGNVEVASSTIKDEHADRDGRAHDLSFIHQRRLCRLRPLTSSYRTTPPPPSPIQTVILGGSTGAVIGPGCAIITAETDLHVPRRRCADTTDFRGAIGPACRSGPNRGNPRSRCRGSRCGWRALLRSPGGLVEIGESP